MIVNGDGPIGLDNPGLPGKELVTNTSQLQFMLNELDYLIDRFCRLISTRSVIYKATGVHGILYDLTQGIIAVCILQFFKSEFPLAWKTLRMGIVETMTIKKRDQRGAA